MQIMHRIMRSHNHIILEGQWPLVDQHRNTGTVPVFVTINTDIWQKKSYRHTYFKCVLVCLLYTLYSLVKAVLLCNIFLIQQKGWDPNEMFATNSKKFNIKSDYDPSLSQYTYVFVTLYVTLRPFVLLVMYVFIASSHDDQLLS